MVVQSIILLSAFRNSLSKVLFYITYDGLPVMIETVNGTSLHHNEEMLFQINPLTLPIL